MYKFSNISFTPFFSSIRYAKSLSAERNICEEEIEELTDSIKGSGLIQPIIKEKVKHMRL